MRLDPVELNKEPALKAWPVLSRSCWMGKENPLLNQIFVAITSGEHFHLSMAIERRNRAGSIELY